MPSASYPHRKTSVRLALLAALLALPTLGLAAPAPVPAAGAVLALDRAGRPVDHFHDGDQIQLAATLPEQAIWPQTVRFRLVESGRVVGACTVASGQRGCASNPIVTQGWRWDAGDQSRTIRVIQALVGQAVVASSRPLQVAARPVVLVHGVLSSWEAWMHYLGPQGYLAGIGLAGFAVGDGQAPGVMDTGSLAKPAARTNTIAQNAAILGDYIANVKRLTGAQRVDLVTHSMGGLIARYYIDSLMGVRDVAQLITLGTPEAGSDCSALLEALGFAMPAALEIRPSYMTGIFNPRIIHRQGVPFHAVAGIAINQSVASPCTGVPSDLVVSLASASAIPVQLSQFSVTHVDMNNSAEVFDQFVKPWLLAPAGSNADEPDPPASAVVTPAALQFSRVITGHVAVGASQAVTIQIEPGLTVASFALYDVTRSLTVTVVGAGGQTLALSPETNGLVEVDDPSTLLYLGYGFENPRPGPWLITLQTTGRTPAAGADFALTAHLQGGASAQAQASSVVPTVGQEVDLSAQLDLAGQPLQLDQAQAVVRGPDGAAQTVRLTTAGAQATGPWRPAATGLFSIDLLVSGRTPDGTPVERSAFLAVEARPPAQPARTAVVVVALCVGVAGVAGLAGVGVLALVWRRRRRAR